MITNPKTFFEQFQNFIEESGLQLKKFKSNLSNYFTKAEAIDTFLGKTDKAESAKTADSVSWEGVTGKPVLAVDAELSDTSTNPIQNKAVKTAIDTVTASIPTKVSALENDAGYIKSVNNTKPDASGNVNVEEYTHPNSGVTAGTYSSVTVNAQGHVTGGSNPILAIANGGTGATTASDALSNLGGVSTSDVANSANKIPRYNSDGHLVLPSGAEFWIG